MKDRKSGFEERMTHTDLIEILEDPPGEATLKQNRKQSLNLAGEFFVASELQRRGIMAAVTYGNAKQADVVAINSLSNRAVVIEVKTTSENEWVLGNSIPRASPKPWALVHVPKDPQQPSQCYVTLGFEIHKIVSERHAEYAARYMKKHGREFAGLGVYKISLEDVKKYRGAWQAIERQVAAQPAYMDSSRNSQVK